MPLLRTTLFGAAALTTIYLLGFLFILIGSPVDQFVDVLDLMRTAAVLAWVMWAVFHAADRVMKELKAQRMAEFADELGVRRQLREDRRAAN